MDPAAYGRHVERLRALVARAGGWMEDAEAPPSSAGEDLAVSAALREAVVTGARMLREAFDGCQELQFDLWKANPAIEENPSIDTEILNAVAQEVGELAETCKSEAQNLSQYHAQRALMVLHRPVRKRTREGIKRDVRLGVADMDEHGWWNVRRTVRGCFMQLDALVSSLAKNRARVLAGGASKDSSGLMVC